MVSENKILKDEIKHSLIIFAVGFVARAIPGYLFFGSVDMTGFVGALIGLFRDGGYPTFPYLPLFYPPYWLAGIISVVTSLPIAFCMKLFPMISDALTAVLIYQILRGWGGPEAKQTAFVRALLFATCPLALMIVSFHSQWDSLSIFLVFLAFYLRDFYRDSMTRQILYGILFAASFLTKPVTVFLLAFFFRPFPRKLVDIKSYLKLEGVSAISLVVSILATLHFSKYFGLDWRTLADYIYKYAKGGIVIFGFPKIVRLADIHEIFSTRLWFVGAMSLVAIPYYFRRIDAFRASMIAYALCIGFSGLAPQYLIWPLAFLILSGAEFYGIAYSVVTTVFLIFYYVNPDYSCMAWENTATFAPLNRFSFLMPSMALGTKAFLPLLRVLGDWIIPLLSIGISLHYIIKGYWRKDSKSDSAPRSMISPWLDPLFGFVIGLTTIILSVYGLADRAGLQQRYLDRFPSRLGEYQIIHKQTFYAGVFPETESPFNIVTLLFIYTALWMLAPRVWKVCLKFGKNQNPGPSSHSPSLENER